MLELLVDSKFILRGYTYDFFRDFEDPASNEFNSYVEPYIHEEVESIEWTDECLYIYVTTEEEE